MIYLLQDEDQMYLLINREDSEEYIYNNGVWILTPPHTEDHFNLVEEFTVETDRDGKTINWWLTKYFDFADATCVKRCKNLDNYKKWVLNHPELFI